MNCTTFVQSYCARLVACWPRFESSHRCIKKDFWVLDCYFIRTSSRHWGLFKSADNIRLPEDNLTLPLSSYDRHDDALETWNSGGPLVPIHLHGVDRDDLQPVRDPLPDGCQRHLPLLRGRGFDLPPGKPQSAAEHLESKNGFSRPVFSRRFHWSIFWSNWP